MISRILAVAPVSRGFGVVVMDVSGKLLDWRVKEIFEPPEQKNARSVVEVEHLIALHRPSTLILENPRANGARKRERIAELLDALAELAIDSGVGVVAYGPREIRAAFALPLTANKDKIAAEVVRRLPALRARLPRTKRIWESERYAMSLFVAASLALTHMSRARRKEGPLF